MIGTVFRVLFGFALSCLAAGLMQVLFVVAPVEWAAPAADPAARATEAGILALNAATQAAIFSAPFALLAAAIAEWQQIRAALYYAIVGLATALGGMSAQFVSEIPGDPTIANPYALAAFAASGVLAGLVYWLASGRRAGGRPRDDGDEPAARAGVEFKQQTATATKPAADPVAKPAAATKPAPTSTSVPITKPAGAKG